MRKILCGFIILILIIFLTGCGNENQRANEEKVDAEIKYMEDMIFTIENKDVKEEYIEVDELNWKLIKQDVQKINNSWAVLAIDLSNIGVQDDKIVNCSNSINCLLVAVGNKNEINVLDFLQKLYENFIDIKDQYTEDKNYVKKMKIKNKILKIYYYAYQNDYTNSEKEITELENYYNELKNDTSYCEENKYNFNNIYVLIQEYKIAIQNQNIDFIKMKYITLIEKI